MTRLVLLIALLGLAACASTRPCECCLASDAAPPIADFQPPTR